MDASRMLPYGVGRAGVEPAEPLAPDLQSGPLPHTVYRPKNGFKG